MKHLFFLIALVATPAMAQDFSEGSEAKTWNLYAEQPARFEAKVVDILCELTGDCPDNCGAGNRQLGLVRSADNVLVFPNKNAQAAFTGAVQELLPYCTQTVEVDGLLLEDEYLGAKNIYLVQRIRVLDSDEWVRANSWTKVWAENHPDAAGKGPWFRRDPRVLAEIASEGYFGLGLVQDEEIKDDLFE
ncbi:hypothetical protein [Yoonia sediminilitoris]|uniref:Uncharacterized protein n=1 Tax=Yoonia sediminilitoris TaxID=1286148 RepID=A0A2T6KJW5_9RHOB|nr:hypothetical protein [Yoonia sediminilitoris]PUB16257.1 hypothetical protein C8N45_103111 [Yoonia sediminilitoris]RCW96606.1 hypothetical protein DFP92_103111 [Yoonia sediminilitoris]